MQQSAGSEISTRGVALFDLDGTLIAWDMQALFCHWILRKHGWRRVLLLPFVLLSPLAKVLGAGGMKRVFLAYLWKLTPEELECEAKAFAEHWFPAQAYPELLAELARHRAEGRVTVLASASPEFYVKEVGRVLGFDYTYGTPVEIGPSMPFFPELENHKGEAKVRRLAAVFGAAPDGKYANSHGYSDSHADLPMLALCEQVLMVNPTAKLAAEGAKQGWPAVFPSRPWTGKLDHARQMLRWLLGL